MKREEPSTLDASPTLTGPARLPPQAPVQRLLQDPSPFAFHQAVRLLQRWQAQPEAPGTSPAPELRFRNSLSLAFPASEIAALKTDAAEGEAPQRIEITPAWATLVKSCCLFLARWNVSSAKTQL